MLFVLAALYARAAHEERLQNPPDELERLYQLEDPRTEIHK